MAEANAQLNEYRKKRDFQRTNEPGGGDARSRAEGIFIVQKHDASKLHYDFRLEHNGVLLSWAVPKGPSVNPADKRLAVHVEDHPVEYASFEGVIPADEYGGGAVIVWDRGTWIPKGDAAEGYRKGHLSFRLNGCRLAGSWSLIRPGSAEDERHWLLLKRDDAEARQDQVTEQYHRSVLSARTLDQVRRENEAEEDEGEAREQNARASTPVSALRHATQTAFPTKPSPQKARLREIAPLSEDWLCEVKFDGYRLFALLENGKIKMLTGQGNDWTDRFRDLCEPLRQLPVKQAVLDGEVVALTPQGSPSFQALQNMLEEGSNRAQLAYFVFDLLYEDGYSLCKTPLFVRKAELRRLTRPLDGNCIRYSQHVHGGAREFFNFACRQGSEGIICKKLDAPYRPGRTPDWIKVKCLKRQEFVVGGYTEPQGSRSGFGALLLGYYNNDGALQYCGRVGTGFTQDLLHRMTKRLRDNELAEAPFSNPPRDKGLHWIKPKLVAEVQFQEWTDEGRLRQPSFKGLRKDKPPREVRKEEDRDQSPTVLSRSSGPSRIAGVSLSHPDKVLYPEPGITKRQVAQYYESVADRILPELAHRPVMMLRCPQGHRKQCFHQKHADKSLPDRLGRVRDGKLEYVYINDLHDLISLVQLNTLEFHPWACRIDDLEAPDRLIFDLDPGDGVEWAELARAAHDLRAVLESLNLATYVRTTGGKGLHLVAPLAGSAGWDTVKAFAGAVARELAGAYPDRFVATMTKKARGGKIFIDHFRNARGATAVASYSTRARPGAGIATPLPWEELTSDLDRSRFTVEHLELPDEPWPGFAESHQTISRKALKALGVEP